MRPTSLALGLVLLFPACTDPHSTEPAPVTDEPEVGNADPLRGAPSVAVAVAQTPQLARNLRATPWSSFPSHPFRTQVGNGPHTALDRSADGRRIVAVGEAGLTVIEVGERGPEVTGTLGLGRRPDGVAITADGARALVAAGDLYVVDLADPSAPMLENQLPGDGLRAVAVNAAGDRAIVGNGPRVFTVDIRAGRAPAFTGSSEIGDVREVALSPDGRVAVAMGYVGATVLDVQGPTPRPLERLLETQGAINDATFAPDGQTLFIALARELVTVDLRTPWLPQIVARTRGDRYGYDLALTDDGDTLFVAGDGFVRQLDVRSATPRDLGEFEVNLPAAVVPLPLDHSVLVATLDGFFVLDLENPDTVALHDGPAGIADTCNRASDVQLSPDGTTAYVAAASLLTLDVRSTPTLLNSHPTALTNLTVSDDGESVYGVGASSMWTFDTSTGAPTPTSRFDEASALPRDLASTPDGETLFLITEGGGGLDVIDIRDPSAPIRVAHHYVRHTESIAFDAANAMVYIADPYENGLLALDVTEPSEPTILGRLPVAITELALCPDGQLLVAAGNDTVLTLDVRRPSAIAILGELEVPMPTDLAVATDCTTAYVTDNFGLRRLDITSPATPRATAFFEVSGAATGVAAFPHSDRVVVTSANAASCVGTLDAAPATLTPQPQTAPGQLRYTLRWTEHFPGHHERIAWHATSGEVTVIEVDQSAGTALVEWTPRPHTEDATDHTEEVLTVAVGNHQYYQLARIAR